jgi:hypothetical protein
MREEGYRGGSSEGKGPGTPPNFRKAGDIWNTQISKHLVEVIGDAGAGTVKGPTTIKEGFDNLRSKITSLEEFMEAMDSQKMRNKRRVKKGVVAMAERLYSVIKHLEFRDE